MRTILLFHLMFILELQDFLIIPNSEERHPLSTLQPQVIASSSTSSNYSNSTPEFKWTVNETKMLIDMYSKYKNKVGTFEIKNQKMLWEKFSEELRKLGLRGTANNCLNRWRVFERNYKKFVDNQNKTGRGRKHFEYKAEMVEIFGKKEYQPRDFA
ncbi:unnamed protein product [Psylliodes chrysocephalus]|uniref:Myb-like domain-containing protein n=1 Tax=Psylliodes chrysocephalus TaxID=3402493 RepID=A0A9P0D8P2_9CUCU|nr:unnamed protein product [Psylliodes chrysocephala]